MELRYIDPRDILTEASDVIEEENENEPSPGGSEISKVIQETRLVSQNRLPSRIIQKL